MTNITFKPRANITNDCTSFICHHYLLLSVFKPLIASNEPNKQKKQDAETKETWKHTFLVDFRHMFRRSLQHHIYNLHTSRLHIIIIVSQAVIYNWQAIWNEKSAASFACWQLCHCYVLYFLFLLVDNHIFRLNSLTIISRFFRQFFFLPADWNETSWIT